MLLHPKGLFYSAASYKTVTSNACADRLLLTKQQVWSHCQTITYATSRRTHASSIMRAFR